jgi:3-hydroxyisobutyrate dehydrogenase
LPDTLCFLGAGLLGAGFIGAACAAGHRVQIWNRSPQKALALAEQGAIPCSSPSEAARGADRLHLVLRADDAVEEVLSALVPWSVPVVDHSTNSPARVAERCARLAAQGRPYLSAPVFMSPANACSSTGLMVVSGDQVLIEALTPALSTMTGKVWNAGPRTDHAAVVKLIGNSVLINLVGAVNDVFAIGRAAGLTPEQSMELFAHFNPTGALTVRGLRASRREWSPASFELAMARKDVGLMLDLVGPDAGLLLLPQVAARMDAHLALDQAALDYAVMVEEALPHNQDRPA